MSPQKFKWKDLGSLLKESFREWNDDEPFRLSAVVAYYAILSLPAILIIIVKLAGSIWGQEAVESRLLDQFGSMLGQDAIHFVANMIENAGSTGKGVVTTVIGIATLVFGATGMFFQLQKSLNYVWEVEAKPSLGFKKFIVDRVFSFGMVLVIALLLLISMVLSGAIAALSEYISANFPEYYLTLIHVLNLVFSLLLITVLFALIFRTLPDVEIGWKEVWTGAFVTAVLFILGKFLLGLYFGMAEPGSTYGMAGTVILILLWVSYSCLILFFGAEFTQVYAKRYGTQLQPSGHAVRTAKYRMREGQEGSTWDDG